MTIGFIFLFVVSVLCRAPLYVPPGDVLEDRYIVVFKQLDSEQALKAELEYATSTYQVLYEYPTLGGYAAVLNATEVLEVRYNPSVMFVEKDQRMKINDCSTPVNTVSWGLTRISETRVVLDGLYSAPRSAGDGVQAYVIDTGVYTEHEDFGNRASFGFKAEAGWSSTDSNGHGTHVASTIAGTKYGVAKKTTVIAVKVLGDDGSGSNAGVIAGVEYAASNSKQSKKRSVANLSLGGSKSLALNAAVNAAVEGGLVVVVAAGNDDADACSGSPSSASQVICVGATDVGASQKDERAYYSNYGSCVDIFAPGTEITGAWITSPQSSMTISGTSMASPHVAGITALLLSENPTLSPSEVRTSILGDSLEGLISLNCDSSTCLKSPNLFVNNGCDRYPNF
eukprot:TRINITY_DN360_c0_g1_i3.p1 TRINITY_DN360_c0_g1~~TRINITY_DN360_c0_g1_i3.p1  ORF type:complete len:397 (-),score=66.34 TRINITY_DN360_c0_g1_i3:78-1268(-)